MSTLETNTIDNVSGSSTLTIGSTNTTTVSIPENITLGASSKTITIPSGATIANSGTATGFGVAGTESFLAILSSNQTVSDNVTTLAQMDTEAYDVGSNYTNTSTFKYTAPSAGKYRFYSNIAGATDGSFAIDNVAVLLYKNGSMIYQAFSDTHQTAHAPDIATVSIDITLDVSASDYFQIYARINSNSNGTTRNIYSDSSRRTWFGGYKVA